MFDLQGRRRVDFANNMCSLIHGHSQPEVVEAVVDQLRRGSAFTMATEAELKFAQLLCDRSDSFDKIRFMNSGTEAVMVAIKAARAFTGKPRIAKAEGAYHGTYDYAEVSQKSSPQNWGELDAPRSVPVAQGTPQSALDEVVIFPFNDIPRTLAILEKNADSLSCVMIDPLPHRVGLIPATQEFVQAIRKWTTDKGILLIFDEVITFRMTFGGAQQWYEVEPDLTAMGKIIGGGFPVGAVAGREEMMGVLDPSRPDLPFPHSGTFSANPITMTAGRVTMERFDREAVDSLNRLGDSVRKGIREAIDNAGVEACVTGAGSMFRVHLGATQTTHYRTTHRDQPVLKQVNALVDHMYQNGFMMINTCSGVLSTAMTQNEIDQFVETLEAGLREHVKP